MYELIHLRMVKVWLHPDWIFSLTNHFKRQKEAQKVINGFIENVSFILISYTTVNICKSILRKIKLIAGSTI